MKRYAKLAAPFAPAVLLTGCSAGAGNAVWSVLLLILAVVALLLAVMQTRSFFAYCRRQRRKGRRVPKSPGGITWLLYGMGAALLILSLIVGLSGGSDDQQPPASGDTQTNQPQQGFTALGAADTDPLNWQIRWEIFENGVLRPSYSRENKISFGAPEDYFTLPGVSTFRGNNYRNNPAYGTANVVEKTLKTVWTHDTGTIAGGSWSGNGWTGQPLIVQWDAQTRQIMNLYPEKKDKADLVEVIYASLDGKIYFMDLTDGSDTRPPLDVGMCFKGAGTLDPRGYPLLYVGSGDVNASEQRPRMYIISLIDGRILYQYGNEDQLAYRMDNEQWCAFDSAPLIHAETDTLIWPGENGILYTIRLNTAYDKTSGTVSVSPSEPVVTRYLTERTSSANYWCGYEASPVIVGNYLYVSENGGMFFCIDLNTMELVWAQDTKDDSNSTPVFERISEQEGYLYTAPSLHWTKDSDSKGTISIYKLDAVTGKILWEAPYHVHTVSGVSGGVQSSPLLGRQGTDLEGMIFYAIARTNTSKSGTLVALDTKTGQEVWRLDMDYYAWSSPVAVYDDDGKGYIVLCDSNGTAHFLNSEGDVEDTLYLGGLVEASPAVYNDMIVVGTRLRKICGIKIR